ncbi:hypothetical protein [Sphingopyxis macrogoltabida]|uniref:Uncharacterized protein n=1 Tax=Sphingopyxis macrogoltabida TaxID=33050 RepID=A0A0N9V3Q0_SPHMC|nr:hypothetical protein [Sphingopyxis macrogoltabida]ALH82936.1 hypothetical protein AN936_22035 [Sphingopyxis macrogoltabida]
MKGADQCPKCASRATIDVDAPSPKGFYSRDVRVCRNCQTIWEPFNPADMFDPADRLASFSEPCNNCAFRTGSPEQKDKEEWKKTIAALKAGGQFFCHKGVPIDIKNANGFAYPEDGKNPRKMRLCRGYLNMWAAQISKEMAAEGLS